MGWRDLYAENQAVIQRHLRGDGREAAVGGGCDAGFGGGRDAPPGTTLRAAPGLAPAACLARPRATLEELDHLPAGPQRWFVHTPPGVATTSRAPLLVMLHGCTQSAQSFVAATGMNEAADRHGFVVLYPEQGPAANQRGCWNWFEAAHQSRGAGEPAAIAGATRAVLAAVSRRPIDPDRVFVAGLSAGGAMAAVLAVTHPDLFAGVAVHSGLAYRSATTMRGAFAAMARGGPHPEREGLAAAEATGARARPIPALVLHGTKDRLVAPVNGEQAVVQWLTMNHVAAGGSVRLDPRRPTETTRDHAPGGRSFTRRRWHDDRGGILVEHVGVEGMGHAWSGGAAGARHSDPHGPSATEAICRFFGRVGAREGG
jgi:poly(hydroxyalkanoate) depolymerase family esterase